MKPDPISLLLPEMLAGDDAAACALQDYFEEKGTTMLPLKVGERYLVETHLWYLIGEVEEVLPMSILFKPRSVQIHSFSDLPTALATGRLATGSEASPIPHRMGVNSLNVEWWMEWPYEIPYKRTHAAIEG